MSPESHLHLCKRLHLEEPEFEEFMRTTGSVLPTGFHFHY